MSTVIFQGLDRVGHDLGAECDGVLATLVNSYDKQEINLEML